VVNTQTANLRAGPGTNYDRLGSYAAGTTLAVTGKSAAGDWIQVQAPDGITGWMADSVLQVNTDLRRVAVTAAPPTPTPIATPEPTATPRPIVLDYPFSFVSGTERCDPNSSATFFDGFVRNRDDSLLNGVCVHIAFFGPRNTKCSGCDGVGNGRWGFSPFGGPAPAGTTVEIFVVECPGAMPPGGQSASTGFGDLTPKSDKWTRTVNASEQCTGITFIRN
jgi:hypothetical protein